VQHLVLQNGRKMVAVINCRQLRFALASAGQWISSETISSDPGAGHPLQRSTCAHAREFSDGRGLTPCATAKDPADDRSNRCASLGFEEYRRALLNEWYSDFYLISHE
jgi:hypothetical protein